jgi:hypothetical protein
VLQAAVLLVPCVAHVVWPSTSVPLYPPLLLPLFFLQRALHDPPPFRVQEESLQTHRSERSWRRSPSSTPSATPSTRSLHACPSPLISCTNPILRHACCFPALPYALPPAFPSRRRLQRWAPTTSPTPGRTSPCERVPSATSSHRVFTTSPSPPGPSLVSPVSLLDLPPSPGTQQRRLFLVVADGTVIGRRIRIGRSHAAPPLHACVAACPARALVGRGHPRAHVASWASPALPWPDPVRFGPFFFSFSLINK